MPTAVKPNPRTAPGEDVDDLFNYDAGLDQARNSTGRDNAQQRTASNDDQEISQGQQNLDEEIKITKKRQPVAKLDEARLLTTAGIPKLRKISKGMRFKGKGHEFSDMSRLLNTYQLWLDDLFPRAKFADGISIIEKLGHKKRLQVMRREWINEGKPKPVDDMDEDVPGEQESPAIGQDKDAQDMQGRAEVRGDAAADGGEELERRDERVPQHEPGEDELDELDALLAEERQQPTTHGSLFGGGRAAVEQPKAPDKDTYADEEEAMAGMMDW